MTSDTQSNIATDAATVQIVRCQQQWETMRGPWEQLYQVSPTAAPPLHWQWLGQWWRTYGPLYGRGGGLRVLAVWRDGRLIGALPLYEQRRGVGQALAARRVGFLSTGEAEFEETCPDYMDLLYRPGEQQTCIDALREVLLDQQRLAWDQLDFLDIAEHSPLLQLQPALAELGRVQRTTRGVCPAADISGGLEPYLERLSANTRQQSRRLLRAAQKAGGVMEWARDSAEADTFLDQLIDLHQARWTSVGQPGCFAAPRFTEFHRALARAWVPAGRAVLARLRVEDRPLAVIYGFPVGEKFHFYQSGVVLDDPQVLKSPGTVAFLLLMDRLAQQGIGTFDFLRGSSGYKQRLATHEQPLFQLRAVRSTWRSGLAAVTDITHRAVRKGRSLPRSLTRRRTHSSTQAATI
jgi:CelD/BcsL family acetyltransferase involved in cellulose biosynthesis